MNYETRWGHTRTHKADGSKRRLIRNESAEAREGVRNTRTPEEQIKMLNRRLGKGMGAKKERTRLQKEIASKQEKSNG